MRILDLCCGGGGAAIGYKTIFTSAEIHGWDIKDMSDVYPFVFNRGDAFALDYEYLASFDLIHMSPPCQRYSKVTPKKYRDNHPHLIPNALRLGYASGLPFVIENVPGSTHYLRPTFKLSIGGRERYFHANFPVENRSWKGSSIMTSKYVSRKTIAREWGIGEEYRIGMRELRQSVPPLMTMHIAVALMAHKIISSCSS